MLVTTLEPEAADNALVDAARNGDRAAFGWLYTRYKRMIHGILLANVPFADAEDLMQDVFTQALQRLSGLRESGAFGGWLATIARHIAVDHRRRNHAALEVNERNAGVARPDEAEFVLDAIQRLPEAYRETLMLRLVEGMTGPEIAEQTGLTPDSVRVNLCRGIKMLREQLGGNTAHG